MGWSIRLFSVGGTAVRIHLTFFLLLAVYAAIGWQQGGAPAAVDLVVFIALLFLCVVLHEFGHVFAARLYGIRTSDVTLLPIGGVASLERMPEKPGQEIVVALAGPAVNVAIAAALVVFLGASFDLGQTGQLGDARASLLDRIAVANVALFVFNLIPAFPMDGGRVLRALLWKGKRDFVWATRVAARVGQLFGVAMVAGGIVLLVVENAFSGAWFAVIGWFVYQAAGEEVRYAMRRQQFGDLRVKDAMARDAIFVDDSTSLAAFMNDLYGPTRRAIYPVLRDGHVVGLLTARRVGEVGTSEWQAHTVSERMVPLDRLPRLRSDETLSSAAGRLAGTELEAGVVTEGDHVVSVLTLADVVRTLRGETAQASG